MTELIFNENVKYLCIAEDCYSSIILEYKQKHPLINVKLINKSTFMAMFSFDYDYHAVAYIMNNFNYTYSQSKKLIKILQMVTVFPKEFEYLEKIKDKLIEENIITFDEFASLEIQDTKVVLFEKELDKELINFLNYKKMQFSFLNINDFYKKKAFPDVLEYYSFLEEVTDLSNRILLDLKNGTNEEDILVYAPNNSYTYSLDIYGNLCGVKYSINDSTLYANISTINKYIQRIDEEKKIYLEVDENDNCLVNFTELLKQFIPENSIFTERTLLNIKEIAKSNTYKTEINNTGIRCIQDITYAENKKIFLLGAYVDQFPKTHKDDNVLLDNDLKRLGLNSSGTLNDIETKKSVDFLTYGNVVFLSYSLHHLADKIYPSYIIKNNKLNVISINKISNFYSNNAANLAYFMSKDMIRKYGGLYSSLKNYENKIDFSKITNFYKDHKSNAFSGVENVFKDHIRLSYSQISSYFSCPYSYYLSKILKLSEFKDNYATKIGSKCHDFLEHANFNETIINNKYDFNNFIAADPELKFALNTANLFDYTINSINRHNATCSFVKNLPEQNITISLGDIATKYGDSSVTLNGKIDSLYVTKFGKYEYATIIDYKSTDNVIFVDKQIEFGGSLQLPIYALLSDELMKESNLKLGGIFIQNILYKQDLLMANRPDINGYGKNMFVGNVIINDINYMDSFDFCENNRYYFTKSITVKEGMLKGSKIIENFDELVALAKGKCIEAAKRILEGDFRIEVMRIDGNNPCDHCEFKSICYKNDSNIKVINTKLLNNDENEVTEEE